MNGRIYFSMQLIKICEVVIAKRADEKLCMCTEKCRNTGQNDDLSAVTCFEQWQILLKMCPDEWNDKFHPHYIAKSATAKEPKSDQATEGFSVSTLRNVSSCALRV